MASPSYDETAERSVLGALLIGDLAALETAKSILASRDFHEKRHQQVFEAIIHLSEQGQPVDLITVQEDLVRRGIYEETGGLLFLIGLFDAVPLPLFIDDYARTVRLCALWRGH